MRAAICTRYGPPEVLQIQDVPTPVPEADELLVRIDASTVTSSDCFTRSGIPTAPLAMRLSMRLERVAREHRGRDRGGWHGETRAPSPSRPDLQAARLRRPRTEPDDLVRRHAARPLSGGVRTFELTDRGGSTVFSMREAYSGLLARMISRSIPAMNESFEQFADGLKAAAEAAS